MFETKSAHTMSDCLGHHDTLTVTCPIRSLPPSSHTKWGWDKRKLTFNFDVVICDVSNRYTKTNETHTHTPVRSHIPKSWS